MSDRDPEAVLQFWFGELDAAGLADEAHARRWFTKDPAFDAEVGRRFAELHAEIAAGQHAGWLASPRGRLAAVIVLDQFSRNMFRDTERMFAFDDRAFELAREGVERGEDRTLRCDERSFLYMPFMHREELAAQDRCVALFADWLASLEGEGRARADNGLRFAKLHRDIVARFGRFPHRNRTLGRETTEEEAEFLKQPNSSF